MQAALNKEISHGLNAPQDEAADLSEDQLPAQYHRAEIDGLRAIAVLAVVFYHFGVAGFSGGFVGVDIFFVISGFVIGDTLWRELQDSGRVKIGAFFMRRMRRLAPAYFAMAFAALAVGSWILLPGDFHALAQGLIAATLSVANILFFQQVDYFGPAAQDQIMLHTWSLSLQAQFYVFLPLILLLFARNRQMLWGVLGGSFTLSLAAALILTPFDQAAVFYLFPFRLWELLAGVGLAIVIAERPGWLRQHAVISWIGLGLVLGAISLVQAEAGFVGWQVVIPVLGALLLMANGAHDNWVNHILCMRLPTLIGAMSYSIYLWHWPVYTLTRYLQGDYAGPAETALWIAIAFVLAALSWRFVEQPVRRAQHLASWSLLSAAVAASALAVSFAFVIDRAEGMPQRFETQAQIHIAASGDFRPDVSRCYRPKRGRFAGIEICPIGPDSAEHNLIIWGDDHARAALDGIDKAAHEANRSGLVIWRAGCAPLFEITSIQSSAGGTEDAACVAANAQIRAALQAMAELRDVVLIGRWSYYASGTGSGNDAQNTIRLRSTAFGPMTQDLLLSKALAATVAEIARLDRDVHVLRQPPEITHYDAPEAARALAHGRLTPQLVLRLGQIRVTDAALRAAGATEALRQSGAQIIDTWDWFCDPFLCEAVRDGVGLYFDNHHITNAAARRMRAVFYPVMARHPG